MACPQSASRIETGTHLAHDTRADHGTRLVTLTSSMIHIERVLRGMKMRVRVPTEVYAGVLLIAQRRPEGEIYEIKLSHRDPDLCVLLGASMDKQKAEELRSQWAVFFARPTLESDPDAPNASMSKPATRRAKTPEARRRCMTAVAKRRPRRIIRRKPGNRENLTIIRRDEREIICYE